MNKTLKSKFNVLLVAFLGFSIASCGKQPTPAESSSNKPIENSTSEISESISSTTSTSVSDVVSTDSSEEKSEVSTSEVSESESEISESESESEISNPEQVDGSIYLDKDYYASCGVAAHSQTYGDYDFELANTKANNDGYITLAKGGYFLNTTPFGDIDSFKVEYSVKNATASQAQSDLGFGGLYYATDSHKITSPRSYHRNEVTNNQVIELTDNPNYIAFYTYNEIEIDSISITYDSSKTYTETFSDFDISLFSTNDIHGQVNADDSHAGLVNAAGYIEKYTETSKYNLMFDQGDIYQGSLACYLTGGHIMDDYLLMEGYESTIIGNHEWDWKEGNILEHREYSPEVKLLACNIRYKDGTTPSWVRNYYTTERGGVKFGVIGAVGDIAGDISADMIENINFVIGNELSSMISGYADELKAQGCDYIILQIHEGSTGSTYNGKMANVTDSMYESLNYVNLANKLDLVLESHSHKSYYHVDNYGIAHIQCGGYLSGLGRMTLGVTWDNNEPTVSIKNVYLNNATYLKNHNSSFFAEVNEWYSTNVYKEESERVVATLDAELNKDAIEQMQAEAYYALKDAYPELASYTVSVGGGHIGARSPQKLTSGAVTMSDVTNLFPFDNEMYLVKIAGKDLKNSFLKTTNKLAGLYDASSYINYSQDYYIIIDSYNYFYMTKQQKTPITLEIVVDLTAKYGIHPRDAFAKYINSLYGIKETFEICNTDFDFNETEATFDTAGGVEIKVTYSGLADNSQYSQFNITKNSGYIRFECPKGYVIKSAEVKQYTTYKNVQYYKDAACANEISYQVPTGQNYAIYTLDVNTNTFVVKNNSSNDLKVYYIRLTLEKVD